MKTILVTGANGEIGHGLISRLAEQPNLRIIALDLHELEENIKAKCYRVVTGDILDTALLESVSATYNFDTIYHLAALLSTKAERQPVLAHKVNVDGTLNLLEMAVGQSRVQGREIKFLYPSSIAVYGLPDLQKKERAGKVKEHEWLTPRTMYGINKLYCEQLGIYYAQHYRQLDAEAVRGHIDFRALRFPGLISAVTVPTGGTSDYAPEMLHAAAQAKPYPCFVREDTRISFMVMPDAIEALLGLEAAPRERLTRLVYNATAFNPSAGEVYELVRRAFPKAQVTFVPDLKRQKIVDSWPTDIDDSAARADWDWKPAYDFKRAFEEYLVPGVRQRYKRNLV
jgi:nucleoside-diphosphate-sugar epimerase